MLHENDSHVPWRDDSIYPSLSLCFGIKEDKLKEALKPYNVNNSVYKDFLKGEFFSETLANIPYKNVTFIQQS